MSPLAIERAFMTAQPNFRTASRNGRLTRSRRDVSQILMEALETRTLLTAIDISGDWGSGAEFNNYTLEFDPDGLGSPVTIAVDWGDGTSSIVQSTDPLEHAYKELGGHTISAYGCILTSSDVWHSCI